MSTNARGRVARALLVVSITLGLIAATAGVAMADTVTNDVVAGGNDTFAAGASTTISYKINGTGGDGQPGCNASDGSAVTVAINAPAGVTVAPATLAFNYCGNPQKPVTFSSSVPGNYAITASAVDAGAGTYNVNPSTFTLHVVNTPPVVTVPAAMVVEGNTLGGATVSYSASALDAEDGPLTPTCTPGSGSFFAVDAVTTVSCSATDASAATTTETFTVTVVDTTPPAVTVPAAMQAEAVGPDGVALTFAATSDDIVDGTAGATCIPPSGSTFPLGTTNVECTGTDAHDNSASASFAVTVTDTTAPVIVAPTLDATEATGPDGAVVTYTVTATDAVDTDVDVVCAPPSGSTFALGTTTVACSAADDARNTAGATFTVAVVDTTAPTLHLPATVTAIAASGSSAVVTYAASADDLVDGAVAIDCSPPSGSSFPVGSTTVTCSADDAHGNRATGTFSVVVSYAWTGFFRPVDNLPVLNSVKAGSSVPVKFSLGGNQGLSIFAAGSPSSGVIACDATTAIDPIETTVTAGGSSLSYDAAANQYVYVWKTDKAWASTCRQLVVKLADGSSHRANFKLTK